MIRLTVVLILAGGALAQDPPRQMSEYELKAGFLYNFAKYVEWPAGSFEKADTPIAVGIVGADPFGPILDKALKDRKAQDRTFTVARYSTTDDLRPCHILFIPATEKDVGPILKKVEGTATMTVGEAPGFAASGGTINILIEKEKPRLEINTDTVEKSGLTVQARLLKLATLVKAEK